MPRLWLLSTGASRLSPKAALRVVAPGVEVTLFLAWARRLFDWGTGGGAAFGSSASPERGARNSLYWRDV